ncbi:hypothetical protein HY407_00750 [Candidatus Gottesmanbacteria bacterium]|nr:hypothetical protein [Candidatus Gottesmanbacteria bacterium]
MNKNKISMLYYLDIGNTTMSANNLITINKKTYIVKEADAETGHGRVVGKGNSLEEAIEIAEKEMDEGSIEYGIHFVNE